MNHSPIAAPANGARYWQFRYRYGGTSDISSTPRIDVAAGRQLLDHIGCQHDEVERLTIVDPAGRIDATHRNDNDRLS